jgi:uncharacterized HAD superfamily protein
MDTFTSLLADMRRDSGNGVRVSIDIDGTIADVHVPMVAQFNGMKGTNFTVGDIKDWGFTSIGSSYEEMMPVYKNVWQQHTDEIRFLGNVAQLRELSTRYEVSFLTSRSNDRRDATGGTEHALLRWLAKSGVSFVPLVICPLHMDKARDYGYNVYIDDSPSLARSIAGIEERGDVLMLLIDKPYNRDVPKSERILRVADVREAVDVLLNAARSSESAVAVYAPNALRRARTKSA